MARKATKATTTATTTTVATDLESPKVTRARSTRAKADVQDAFNDISAELANQEVTDPKFAEIIRANETRVRTSVAGLTVEKTIQSISNMGLEISRGLNQVSEVLTQKLAELQDVSDAVDIQSNELTRLHKLDVAASSLDSLVADYHKQQIDFEADMVGRKLTWAKEEADHARFLRERNEEAEKARKRESSDYEYAKAQERKFAQAAFEEELNKLSKSANEKQEVLAKQWLAREEVLKARENELTDLRQQVSAFPDALKKEVSKAEAIITNTMTRNHSTEMTLLKKDMETTSRLASQEIAGLKIALEKQVEQTNSLQAQLAAEKQVSQSVVLKALDSASDQRALREVTNFASGRDSNASAKK